MTHNVSQKSVQRQFNFGTCLETTIRFITIYDVLAPTYQHTVVQDKISVNEETKMQNDTKVGGKGLAYRYFLYLGSEVSLKQR